jgi:hypothetical protein
MNGDSGIVSSANDKTPLAFVMRELRDRWPDADALDEARLEREQARVRSGVDAWILQSYVRLKPALRARGFEVSISEAFVRGAICIAHRDDLNRYGDPLHDCFVVGARADRPPLHVARIEVVQNGLQASPRARFIPSWPQPGLIARAAARAARVENVVYLGRAGSVPAWYRDGRLAAGLEAIGARFEIREKAWNDYSDVDVVLAHREEGPVMLRQKPGAKLVNAWLAGVPALLGPEPAYAELRRSALDYVEARGVDDVLNAVRALHDDPKRYQDMVDNGSRRALEFDAPATAARWLDLIANEVRPAFEEWRRVRPGPVPRYFAHLRDMSAQKLAAKAFRRTLRAELKELASSAPA